MLGAPTSTLHLKNRLDSLRKMFDEDNDMQIKAKQGFYTNNPPPQHFPNFDYEQKIPRNVFDHKKERKGFQS